MASGRESPTQTWVIDTSSIIQVRREVPKKHQRRVYSALTRLVRAGVLVYPKAVLTELERYHDPEKGADDLPHKWALENKDEAMRVQYSFEELKAILARVPDVLDRDRAGIEEADHHVLAVAQVLRGQGVSVSVVTEDRQDKPIKLSLTTAAGMLLLPVVPLHALMRIHGIEVDPEG